MISQQLLIPRFHSLRPLFARDCSLLRSLLRSTPHHDDQQTNINNNYQVTSPQAFEGLRLAGRSVRRPDGTLVTVDHNVPTTDRSALLSVQSFIDETASRTQVLQLEANVADFGLKYFGMADERQGIVHIIGPEQGFTLPGTTTVCGDSHTATHGAFGSIAFGIGTSEVEHVLATSTLPQTKARNMLIRIEGGELGEGVTSKDIILHVCGVIGTAGELCGCCVVVVGVGVGVAAMQCDDVMQSYFGL